MRATSIFILLLLLCAACSPALHGDQALDRGDTAQALALYQEALAKDPGSVSLRLRIGLAYLAMPDYARAEASFLGVLELTPNEPEAVFHLGLARLGLGQRQAGLDTIAALGWPGRPVQQRYVQDQVRLLRQTPDMTAQDAIRSLREALAEGRRRQEILDEEKLQNLRY